MDTAIVTTKGQLVIPSKLRNRLGIKKGTKVCFVERPDGILLRPLTGNYIDSLRGSMRTEGQAGKIVLAASQE